MFQIIKKDIFYLGLLVILGLILRLDFMIPGNYIIDGDEAIVGLMAKHMLEGKGMPVFYYGQHYMGSLEPILVGLSFKVFGVNSFAMKLVPLTFSLALIVLVYLIGNEISGKFVARVSALFIAIPPTTLVVWSGKARGGFIEIVFIGALSLLLTIRWLKAREISLSKTFLIGLVLGFGWWVNNQIIFFMMPVGLLILSRVLWQKGFTITQRILQIFINSFVGLVAFILGGLPFWIYNVQNNFISFEMFRSSGTKDILAHLYGLFSISIPILLGSKRFWEYDDTFDGATIIYAVIYSLLFLVFLLTYRRDILSLFVVKASSNASVQLILLFILATFSIFVVSSFGYLVQAPRYLLPVYVGIYLVCACAIKVFWERSALIGSFFIVAVLSMNLASSYAFGHAVPGEPFVFKQERVSKDHSELIKWLEENKISWVRTNYWIGYRLSFETLEKVKFDMFQEPTQVRIPSYREEARDVGVNKMPFILVPAQAKLVEKALSSLGYTYKTIVLSGYRVVYEIHSPREELEFLDADIFEVTASHNQQLAKAAIDDDIKTRWGSGQHQTSGMQFSIKLGTPRNIGGVRYELGEWPHDWPRALRVEVIRSDDSKEIVFDDKNYLALRYFTNGNDTVSIYFEPRLIKEIILTQVSEDKVFDWSIAELNLYEAK